jgi:hypothetical protein
MDSDGLYGLPLDRFVSERDALARTLRADRRREEAAGVASLRKPSVAAWAINQLVRTQGRAVARLFETGDALREAQAAVVAGRGEGRILRAAAEHHRAAVDALVRAARGLLSSDGHELSAATIDRVAETLRAAALDDEARRLVRDGRLERELRHVGFPSGDSASKAPARRVAGKMGSTRPGVAAERAAAQRAKREHAKARETARAAEADARRRSDRAARAVAIAEDRRERAAQALRDADERLAAARAEAEAATTAHRRARDDLENS